MICHSHLYIETLTLIEAVLVGGLFGGSLGLDKVRKMTITLSVHTPRGNINTEQGRSCLQAKGRLQSELLLADNLPLNLYSLQLRK